MPDDWEIQFHYGYLLIKRGEVQKAKEILKVVLRKNIPEEYRREIRQILNSHISK